MRSRILLLLLTFVTAANGFRVNVPHPVLYQSPRMQMPQRTSPPPSVKASSRSSLTLRAMKIASTSDEQNNIVEGPFEGRFGLWFVDTSDAQEVLTYRLSLVGSALFLTAGVLLAVSSSLSGSSTPEWALDLCAAGFLASFGVSLATIHIYMKPLHNMLKALWAGGSMGALAILLSSPTHHVVGPTYEHPELLLASGWVFVALTGLFFKEFACFQRWEASALFALVPILTGGHFLHILPAQFEMGGALALSAVFVFFALRKFNQPYRADIGDKTVFDYMAQQEGKA